GARGPGVRDRLCRTRRSLRRTAGGARARHAFARRPARAATARDRARLLRRAHAERDRRAAPRAARHGENAPARRHGKAARRAGTAALEGCPMTDHRWTELAAPYALGALDSGERVDFERHLETCAECRAEVQAFREVAGRLAQS